MLPPRNVAAVKAGWVAAAVGAAAGAVAVAAAWAAECPRCGADQDEMLFDKLKLNKDQKEEAVTILSAAMEKAAPMRDLLNKGRVVIANTITAREAKTTSRS